MTMQPRTLVREMSIQRALEWAFGAEKAQIDFDATGAHEFDRIGVDPLWRGMQLAILGTAVDGGGTSDPHPDAQIIASFVSALPISEGGRRMAIQIAELARAGRAPDWQPERRRRCEPLRWSEHENQHGPRAEVRDAAELGPEGWPNIRRRNRRGREVVEVVQYCPVIITPTAGQIGAARRNYLAWIGALYHLHATLKGAGLTAVRLTDQFPPLAPWSQHVAHGAFDSTTA